MKKIIFSRSIVLGAVLILSITGCKHTLPPVISATVQQNSRGNIHPDVTLNHNQVQKLSAWFSQHDAGWSSSVISYAPYLLIRAKHKNEDTSSINIMPNIIVIYNKHGQFSLNLKPGELTELKGILETQ